MNIKKKKNILESVGEKNYPRVFALTEKRPNIFQPQLGLEAAVNVWNKAKVWGLDVVK